jgi:hypothetical protein
VDSLQFELWGNPVRYGLGTYLSFADGTPLFDYPRPASFPSNAPYSYSQFLGALLGGTYGGFAGGTSDPGSIVGPDANGNYVFNDALHIFPFGTGGGTLSYALATGSGYPRTTMDLQGDPAFTATCTESVARQAFDCVFGADFKWNSTVSSAPGQDMSGPACQTHYAGKITFHRKWN